MGKNTIIGLTKKDIEYSFNKFQEDRITGHRYASFDYCFRYFQTFNNKKDIAKDKNLEMSCLHLGFYLASWGMLRASSILLKKSLPFYKKIIKIIAEDCDHVWGIDVHQYLEKDNIDSLIELHNKLAECIPDNHRTLVIVTKIMMGVFGCYPAFDNYFSYTFKTNYGDKSKFTSFNEDALETIYKFYYDNKDLIIGLRQNCKVLKFQNGMNTNLRYTRAKVIDMIGFQYGFDNSPKPNKKRNISI